MRTGLGYRDRPPHEKSEESIRFERELEKELFESYVNGIFKPYLNGIFGIGKGEADTMRFAITGTTGFDGENDENTGRLSVDCSAQCYDTCTWCTTSGPSTSLTKTFGKTIAYKIYDEFYRPSDPYRYYYGTDTGMGTDRTIEETWMYKGKNEKGEAVYERDDKKMTFKYDMTNGLQIYSELAMPGISKVIFNPPATVVMWDDGTKTVVKAKTSGKKKDQDKFSEEIGLAMAIAKKYYGSRSAFQREVKNAKRTDI